MSASTPPRGEGPWFQVGQDSVRLLRDGVEAFPAMLQAIAAAKSEVLLEMYWVGADACGGLFRDVLADKARAGVPVRVIYDAVGSLNITPEWWSPLVDAGGEVHVYHPLSPLRSDFRWKVVEARDHRKMLIVDGELGFTGGINLSAEWLPIDEGGEGWRDDMIAVRGPTAEELRSLFYRTHRSVTGEKTPSDVRPIPSEPTRPVWVLATRTLPRRRVHREYLVRIKAAKERIDIANSYFIPDQAVRRALFRAVDRGVKVRVLLPEKGDVPVVHYAVEASFESLLGHGVELYSLPGPMLHAKTAIVDDVFATIGSYNLDERSWRKNLEVNIAVEDAAFARHLRKWFDSDVARARRVDLTTWRARPLGQVAVEWVALALRKFW